MSIISKLDEKYQKSAIWQFLKFNLVSFSVSVLQILLANLLPLIFDSVTAKLPPFLQIVFDSKTLFPDGSKYVVDGVVTWGYVLPFLLSNTIANIYGYFVNMKATFKGKGSRGSFIAYVVILIVLILFTTWLQSFIVSKLAQTSLASLSRTLATLAAGFVQMMVLFPLEKYVLFKH